MRALLFAVLSLGIGVGVEAAEHLKDADGSLPGCRDFVNDRSDGEFGQGICIGQIASVWSMSEAAGVVCVPLQTDFRQVIYAVIAHIETHPEELHVPMAAAAWRVLTTIWPCADGRVNRQ